MTDPSTVEPIAAPHKYAVMPHVSLAVVMVAAAAQIQAAWEESIDRHALIYPPIADKQDALSFSKLLLDQMALLVLMNIWKESTFVPAAELEAGGFAKSFATGKPINAHAIAYELTDDKKDMDRNQKAVRNIVRAAVAYGLVERRDAEGCNAKELCGTARLNSLMKHYAEGVAEIVATAAAQMPEMN